MSNKYYNLVITLTLFFLIAIGTIENPESDQIEINKKQNIQKIVISEPLNITATNNH